MLTREQAIDLAKKHDIPISNSAYENILKALIEASRGDFHLKLEAAKKPTKQERQGFNDWKNPT